MIFRHKTLLTGLFMAVCGGVQGHSGGTDANGCHMDHVKQEFHCDHPEDPPPTQGTGGGTVTHTLSDGAVIPLEKGVKNEGGEVHIGQDHNDRTTGQATGGTIENKGCMAANYDVNNGVLRIPQLYVVDGGTNSWQNVTMEGAQFTGKGVTFSTFSIK